MKPLDLFVLSTLLGFAIGCSSDGSGSTDSTSAGASTQGGAGHSGGFAGEQGQAGEQGEGSLTTGGATASTGGGASGSSTTDTGNTIGGAGAGGSDLFDVEYELASDVDPEACSTVGIVTFSLNGGPLVEARIEFGLDTSYGMTAPVDLEAPNHSTLLLGMKPARTYHFRIVASDESSTYTSEDYTIETGPPTDLVSLGEFAVLDAERREPGFFVMSHFRGEGNKRVVFIVDADGEIVWWYGAGPSSIMRAAMSADGKNMWMVHPATGTGRPLQRVSMDTLDAQKYSEALGSHDITAVSGDLMAYLDYGEDDCDSIYEIDPSGETREIFESQDVLSDVCHGNALRYSAAEDVYTFSDHKNDIFVVNRSGAVESRLSDLVEGGHETWGLQNHGHQLLDDSFLFFANRGGEENTSAIFEYSLEGEQLMFYENGLLTEYAGDVQRLPGGNTLVTYSVPGVIEELDGTGEVVLRINASAGHEFGYVSWRPSLYGPPSESSL